MHLQLVYESSMSSVKSFEFMTYLFDMPNALKCEIFKSRSWPTFLGYDLIDIISTNIHLQLVYEYSISSNKSFKCNDLLI